MKKCVPVAALWLAAPVLLAQEFRGTFSGTVTDAQGAAVAKVKIIATETRTGTKSETFSEVSGAYTVPFLALGQYEITAEAPGFKKFVRQGVTLSAGQHPVIDIRLDVGAVSQEVTVTADAPLIESANGSVGQVITGDEVEDFPLAGRTPLMLAQLALGVISTGMEPGQVVRPFDNGAASSVSLGGGPGGGNELLYNGAPNAGYSNQDAYSPPHDSVQQVRVNVFEPDASYGHTGGGTANLITKQGTNSLHGSASEFFQNSYLNANSFYNNARALPKLASPYNHFGASAGGPVLIPKVFNGKNRAFWYFAWEGVQASLPDISPLFGTIHPSLATVPTTAERQGDLSGLLKANKPGTDYTIYNPFSGVQTGNQVSRTPFPGNIIPPSLLNPLALKYLQFFPQPTNSLQINGFQNYNISISDHDGYDNELGRLDLNLSNKNKLSFDVRHNFRAQSMMNYFGNISTGQKLYRINQGSSLDDVYTVSPTVVMDIRANWTRYVQTTVGPSNGVDPVTLGFPSYLAGNATALRLPEVIFTSFSSGPEPSFQSLFDRADANNSWDVFQLFGDVIKIHGNHTVKAGADLREYRWSQASPGFSTGTFTFNSNWTNGPLNNAPTAPLGQDFAAFLLGLPSSGSYPVNASSTAGMKYTAFFVQDDWRARSNLTVNMGLRWEHETPATERFNRAVNGFDPAVSNPVSAAAAAAYANSPVAQISPGQFHALGGLTFAGPTDPYIYHTNSSLFSPRFGFAWMPNKLHTVVRGGFGIFVIPVGLYGNGETSSTVSLNQQGFSQTTQFVATSNNYLSPAGTLSNPFPNGIAPPAGAKGGTGTFLGQGITFFTPQARNGYSLRVNFGIQRQLPGQMVLEVVYIGNHSVRLPITTQLDYLPRQYLSASPVRDQTAINLLGGSVPNPFKGLLPNSSSLNGSTVALGQVLIPFPQFPLPGTPSSTSNGVVMQGNLAGGSCFNSLNVRLQKRFTNGLTFMNNFVWSNKIERTSYLNDSDPAPEKHISGDSRPLREVLAGTYELPVGRKKLLDLGSRAGNAFLGGWKLSGGLTLQTGPPLGAWGNVIYLGGPLKLNNHQPDGPTFDVTRFATASNQQLGYNVRTFDTQFGNLRRNPTKNLDASMSKNFPLGEHKYLQMRLEAFNVTNRVTFGAPNLSPTSTAFATISAQANTPRNLQLGLRLVW